MHSSKRKKERDDKALRPERIKILEENTGHKLFDIGLGDDFLDLTPEAKPNKQVERRRKQNKKQPTVLSGTY